MVRYDKYKDSGIEWIGKIPEHWEISTIGRISNLGRGRVINTIEINKNPGEYPIYSSQTKNNGIMGYINTYDFEGKYVTWTTDGANAGTVSYREGKFNCTNVCGTIQPKNWDIIDLRFLPYFLNLGTKYSVRLDINPKLMNNMMAKIPIVIPPKQEQTSIANYLNRKTAQIDELIAKKERLLELYEEEKTAIINQAVTKGINPDIPMKDSGIDWLGEIPEHWEVKKLKYLVDINKEKLSEKTDSDYQIEYIDIGNVDYGKLREKPQKLLFGKAPSRARRIIKSGDTLISTVRTYLKAILFIENANDHLIASTGFAVVTPSNMFLPKYLFYILSSENILQNITANSVGVSYPAINASEIGEFYCWFPEITEQTAIVEHIEKEINRINGKAEKTKKLIDLLKEYKQALISEVVTGKIKVV